MTQGALLKQSKPWSRYKRAHGRLMEPGWAGSLDPTELAILKAALLKDQALSYWWGWRPSMVRRSEAVIQAVALYGDPLDRALNVRLRIGR